MCVLTVVIGSVRSEHSLDLKAGPLVLLFVFTEHPALQTSELSTQHGPFSLMSVICVVVQHDFYPSLLRGEDVNKKIQSLEEEGGSRVICHLSPSAFF